MDSTKKTQSDTRSIDGMCRTQVHIVTWSTRLVVLKYYSLIIWSVPGPISRLGSSEYQIGDWSFSQAVLLERIKWYRRCSHTCKYASGRRRRLTGLHSSTSLNVDVDNIAFHVSITNPHPGCNFLYNEFSYLKKISVARKHETYPQARMETTTVKLFSWSYRLEDRRDNSFSFRGTSSSNCRWKSC